MTISKVDYPKNWIEANFLIRNVESELNEIKYLTEDNIKRIRLNKLFGAVETILYNLDIAIKSSDKDAQKKLQITKQVLNNWVQKEKFFKKTINNL